MRPAATTSPLAPNITAVGLSPARVLVEFPGSGFLRNARNNVATLATDPADGLVFASAREATDFLREHAPLVVRLVNTRLRRWDSCIRGAGA